MHDGTRLMEPGACYTFGPPTYVGTFAPDVLDVPFAPVRAWPPSGWAPVPNVIPIRKAAKVTAGIELHFGPYVRVEPRWDGIVPAWLGAWRPWEAMGWPAFATDLGVGEVTS